MSRMILLGLRLAQVTFALVILGLSAYIANWYNVDTLTSSPFQINWLLFSSVFTVASILYIEGGERFAPKIVHPLAVLAIEGLNTIFYFGGFISLSVFLSKLLFCRGSVCGSARADVAFGAFEWLLWTATLVFTVRDASKTGIFSFRQIKLGRSAPAVGPQMKESQLA